MGYINIFFPKSVFHPSHLFDDLEELPLGLHDGVLRLLVRRRRRRGPLRVAAARLVLGCNSIDILGNSQHLSLIMLGVLGHV